MPLTYQLIATGPEVRIVESKISKKIDHGQIKTISPNNMCASTQEVVACLGLPKTNLEIEKGDN